MLKCNLFLWCQSWTLSSHYSGLQCHMILQKSFLYANLLPKEHFLVFSILKTVVLLNIFVESVIHFFRLLRWTEISCNKIKIFTVTVYRSMYVWCSYLFWLANGIQITLLIHSLWKEQTKKFKTSKTVFCHSLFLFFCLLYFNFLQSSL